MEKKITCVIVPVGHPAHRAEVVPKLKDLQRLVDGYIEIISLNDDFLLICDEEAKINGKPGNRHKLLDELFPLFIKETAPKVGRFLLDRRCNSGVKLVQIQCEKFNFGVIILWAMII